MTTSRILTALVLILPAISFSHRSEAAPEELAPAHLVFVPYEGAVLERIDRFDKEWTTVCAERCEVDLEMEREVAHARYRIRDFAGHESFSFRITAAPGERVVLTAHPGSPTAHDVGIWTTALSGVALAASMAALVVVGLEASISCRRDPDYAGGGYYPDPDCPSFVPVGLAIGASALAMTIGIAMIVGNNPSASQSLDRAAQSLFVRKPILEGSTAPRFDSALATPARELGPALPPASTAALVTLHF